MPEPINIYCDETCHLEVDVHRWMVIGALWCPASAAERIKEASLSLRGKHGLRRGREMKWRQIAPANKEFYLDMVRHFFESSDLNFRAFIIDKHQLNHAAYGHTHDEWYYKMVFDTLKILIQRENEYHLYLDHKDSLSYERVPKLHDVLCNNFYDTDRQIVKTAQTISSKLSPAMQLCDVLIGAVAARCRGGAAGEGKKAVVELFEQSHGRSLNMNTKRTATKVNLFRWETGFVREGMF